MPTQLNSPFLEAQDPSARQHVLELAESTAKRLGEWVALHPNIRAVRVKPLSLTLAASAPFCSPTALDSTGRISMWIFTVDDIFDEETVAFDDLVMRCSQYYEIARGSGDVDEQDEMACVLQEIIDDLAQYSVFAALRGVWAEALKGTLDGMIQEHRWRCEYRASGDEELPSYDDYLAVGLYSIGGPPHFMTAAITAGDRTVVEHIDSLQRLAWIASAAIRLANDLQSYAKEISERNINSVLILQREDQGRTLEDARGLVQVRMTEILGRVHEMAEIRRTATGTAELAFANIAQFVCEFYISHDYHHEFVLASDIDSNLHVRQSLASTAYDTAWVAGLASPMDPRQPRYPLALRWIVEHQRADGSWGGELRYEHDRVISTLAALRPLLRFRPGSDDGSQLAIERAQRYLWQHGHALAAEPHELVGFEILLPTLIRDVTRAGLSLPPYLDRYDEERKRKLAMLPPQRLYSRDVTIVHSLEFLGEDVDVERLVSIQAENGSIGNSPAATAFLLGLVENEAAACYLEQCLANDREGGVTVLYPCRIFEILWTAYHRFIGGTPARDVMTVAEFDGVRTMLDRRGGVSLDETFPIPDADDTAVALILLHEAGETPPWGALDGFRLAEGHFASYPYERHPSSGVNIHVLDALRRMPPSRQRDEDIVRVVDFLARIRTNGTYWFDKWHISPYYATSHAIVVLRDIEGSKGAQAASLAAKALDWIRYTQHDDGSWGFYEGTGTAEETAYCLLALCAYPRVDRDRDAGAIERALDFLIEHNDSHWPPLWMDKCLYLPPRIVESVIEAARRRAHSFRSSRD